MSKFNVDIREARNTLINKCLIYGAWLGLPVNVANIAFNIPFDRPVPLILDLAGYLLVVIAAIYRKRLAYELRAGLILVLLYSVGIRQLVELGLLGFGVSTMLVMCLLSAVIFNMRVAFASVVAGVIAVGGVAWLIQQGYIVDGSLVAFNYLTFRFWMLQSIGIIFYGMLFGILVQSIQKSLTDTIAALSHKTDELSKTTEKLQAEIDERVRAEASLSLTESKLASALRSSPNLVFVMKTDDGLVTDVSDRVVEALGVSRGELRGKSWRDLWQWLAPDELGAKLAALEEGDHLSGFDVKVEIDNKPCTLNASASSFAVASDKYVVVVCQDVTEARDLERRFRESQKLEMVGQLAGGVAHDYNNMLQAIRGYTDLALDRAQNDEQLKSDLHEIAHAVEGATAIVKKLLAFGRRNEMQRGVVSLRSVVNHTFDLVRHTLPETIAIDLRIAPDRINVNADSNQLEQAIVNLCVNARDAMPDGGTITVETGACDLTAKDCADAPWAEPGRFAYVRVLDTGTGISEDIRGRIFEPFFSTKPPGEGTGLGMSTVYAAIQDHGGVIKVESEEDRGTAITLFVPFSAKEADASTSRSATPSYSLNGLNVLVAEDEPAVLVLAKRILEKSGCTVFSATNGKEAITLYDEHRHELSVVVLDAIMPEVKGEAVYRAIREDNPDLPVVFASGYDFGSLEEVTATDPYVRRIQKPYSIQELIEAIVSMAPAAIIADGGND